MDIMYRTLRPVKQDSKSIDDLEVCTECSSSRVVVCDPHGIHICLDCFSDMGAPLDFRPDWRPDDKGDDTSRCNIPRNELLPDSSMSICLGGKPKGQLSHDLARTLIWNSVSHGERSLRVKLDDIAYVCRQNGIPEAIIESANIYYHNIIRKLETENLRRKRANNDKGLKAASLFLAFQIHSKPKTYPEVAQLFNIDTRYVSNAITLFQKLGIASPSLSLEPFIHEFADSLNLLPLHKKRLTSVVKRALELGILENNIDTSIVAGALSFVAAEFGLPLKPSDISQRCNVSVPTINKVADKLTTRSLDLID